MFASWHNQHYEGDKETGIEFSWSCDKPRLLEEIYEVHQKYNDNEDLFLLKGFVQNPRTPPYILDSIFENYISQNPKKFSSCLAELAENEKTASETLEKLAKLVQTLLESQRDELLYDVGEAEYVFDEIAEGDESKYPCHENGVDVLFTIYEHPHATDSLRQSIAAFIGE